MIGEVELVIRLLEAAFLGGLVGYERERFNKPAGLRTNMLVCLGTALIIIYAENAFPTPDSWARVASGLITGVGFLGAGAIMQSKKRVRGLTTAATIWVVAIIGMAVGGGQHLAAIVATIIVLGILYFSRIEEKVVAVEEKFVGTGLPSVSWRPIRQLSLGRKNGSRFNKTKTKIKKQK
ncbi:MAG: MgtC/SapB family protein [Candidatus Micrarchaeota archaeon]